MQHSKKIAPRHLGLVPRWPNPPTRIGMTANRPVPAAFGASAVSRRSIALIDVSPNDWRILVLWTPDIAVERLARDIRSGRLRRDGLRARARDLRAHLRPEIRERARSDFFPALDMGDDGLNPGDRFD
jgi:hypothetical protein